MAKPSVLSDLEKSIEEVRVSPMMDRSRTVNNGKCSYYPRVYSVECRIARTWFAIAYGPKIRTFETFERADAVKRAFERRLGLKGVAA